MQTDYSAWVYSDTYPSNISIIISKKNIYIQIRFFHRKKLNSLSKKSFVAIISKFLN